MAGIGLRSRHTLNSYCWHLAVRASRPRVATLSHLNRSSTDLLNLFGRFCKAQSFHISRCGVIWDGSMRSRAFPGRFVIYEGHEDETPEEFAGFVAELKQRVKFEVRGVLDYRGWRCDQRTLAVLVRKENLVRQQSEVVEVFSPLTDANGNHPARQPATWKPAVVEH